MPTLDITDDHRDRIETLREELAAAHAGEYASVETADALNYLLDLAGAVDDPGREADPEASGRVPEGDEESDGAASSTRTFDRETARERLEARNRKHGDPDDESEMDLYGIAAALDVAGRSEMTKADLIEAILDEMEQLAADPFSWIGVDLDEADIADGPGPTDESEVDDAPDADASDTPDADDETGGGSDDGGAGQLDAMMSLLDTHDDKWREGDGDARYEVDLPDGDVETARTKDDVRALLFRNY